MFIVTLMNNYIETPIHSDTEKLYSGKVVKGINSIDSFSFSLLPSNAGFGLINPCTTRVSVFNTRTKSYELIGRVLYPETTMSENGLISKDVTCESVFGYLCDSQQTYVAAQNWTVSGLLEHLIDCHNSQVEEYKHFTIGEVTVTDPNDNLYLGIQRENTWDAINSNLIKKLGGELRYRVEDDVNYIDYLEKIGENRTTEIALSVNMKSITREQDPTEYITRLIPLGCKLTSENESTGQTVETEERLDISSVNGGLNYIDDAEAIAVYGIHVGYVEFDDVTKASTLLAKGKKWMAENNKVQVKYSITALELASLGLAIDEIEVHNYHPIKNRLIGVDDTARIIKKTIDVCEEVKSSFEIGDNFKTLSDIQREQAEQLKDAMQNVQVIQTTTNNLQNQVSNVEQGLDETSTQLRESILTQTTTLTNTCNEIILAAMEAYTLITTHEEFRQIVESQLQLMSDEMTLKFTETIQRIQAVDGDLQSKFNEITKYFTFDINGLTIGQIDNPYKVIIDNDRYSMTVNNIEVLWFDAEGKGYIPELTITKKLDMFGYVISEDDNGNINCVYAGG